MVEHGNSENVSCDDCPFCSKNSDINEAECWINNKYKNGFFSCLITDDSRLINSAKEFKRLVEEEDMSNKVEITLNGNKVVLDVTRARELGLIEDVKKELIERSGKHCKYYTIRPNGILDYHYEDNSTYNSGCYDNGDYFSSDKVAQAKIDQCLGLTGRIQAYILEENERANWVANWEDDTQKKYYIVERKGRYTYEYISMFNIVGVVVMSESIAKELVRKLNDGWR